MIETEEQRRWWFATHPEYSWSRRGIRKEGGVDPEEVDKYVDKALKYETGPVADLLKSVKRNFGTQAQDSDNNSDHSGHTTKKRVTNDRNNGGRFRKYSNEELHRMGIPTPEEEALISDPHTFLDIAPYRRFVTAPISAFKDLFRGAARDTILNAVKKGETGAEQAPVRTTISKT